MRKILLTMLACYLAATVNTHSIIIVESLYRLGEAGVGTDNAPKDSSGNARDFQIVNAFSAVNVAVSSVSPAPGSTHYYTFNGDLTGFSEIGWDAPEDNIGIECWARAFDLSFTTGVTVGAVVFGTGQSENGLAITMNEFGAGFVGDNGPDWVGVPYMPRTTNEWVHLAVVRDNGVTTFYLNGVAQAPIRTSVPGNSTVAYMGQGTGLTNFVGALDEARIFSFAPGEFYKNDLLFFQSTNTAPYVTAFRGTVSGFTIKVQDKTTTLNTNTISVSLDGAPASTTISQSAGLTTLAYTSPTPFASASTHSVTLVFADSAAVWQTNQMSFTVQSYIGVPASYAVTGVNTGTPGFMVRPYQTDGQTALGQQPNSLAWTEEQLNGLHGDNIANTNGVDADGFFAFTSLINLSIEAGSGTERGNFSNDQAFPGIPGIYGTGNATEEILTFLQFPAAGVYNMGVNSDDGFKVTVYPNPRDRFALVLGQFDGGRGATDTTFAFYIPQAGFYPFRLIWENGNGELPGNQANLEWFSVLDNGTKVLINDSTSPIKAYRVGPAAPPYVSRVAPGVGERGALPSVSVVAEITDGSTQVNAGSVRMGLNSGELGAPTSISKSGKVTTATLIPGAPFQVGSTVTAQVAFSDTGSYGVTNTWQFTILSASLPPGLRTPPGSGVASQPGFKVRTYQVDFAIQNELPIADQMAHGVSWRPNVADLSAAVNGVFDVPGTINWGRDAGSVDIGKFQSPDYPDAQFPGIPGTAAAPYENMALEARTFIEFPSSGIYTMGVNSDDGFRVTVADSTGPDFGGVRIAAPSNLVSNYPCWPTYWANGGLFGGPLPKPNPVVRFIVKADDGMTTQDIYTMDAGDNNASYTFLRAAPTNGTQLAGNIAVVRRGGGIPFAQKARYCQDAGAVAVIVVNRPDIAGTLPFGMGGSDAGVTIPVVMMDWAEYANFWPSLTTSTNSGVIGSVSEDCSPLLGEFDSGRGEGTPTLFTFLVPQAGVYPLRLLYWQGQGGANCELFSVDSAGNYILVNDTLNPAALKAFRARTVATRGQMNPPVVSGANVTLSWTQTGELEHADSITGPWVKAPDQSNPQTKAATGRQKFYRLRVY